MDGYALSGRRHVGARPTDQDVPARLDAAPLPRCQCQGRLPLISAAATPRPGRRLHRQGRAQAGAELGGRRWQGARCARRQRRAGAGSSTAPHRRLLIQN
jgi:hypothetical protein